MDKLILPTRERIKVHHSLTDWDWGAIVHDLDTAIYVTAPSSLHTQAANWANAAILCRHEDTVNLPEGRIETWKRASTTYTNFCFTFRHQAAVGTVDRQNCYTLVCKAPDNNWQLYRYNNGDSTGFGYNTKIVESYNTWYHCRVTWWEEALTLRVMLEYEIDGEWVQQGIIEEDPDNWWGATGRARVGFSLYSGATRHQWIDDTDLYTRSP